MKARQMENFSLPTQNTENEKTFTVINRYTRTNTILNVLFKVTVNVYKSLLIIGGILYFSLYRKSFFRRGNILLRLLFSYIRIMLFSSILFSRNYVLNVYIGFSLMYNISSY